MKWLSKFGVKAMIIAIMFLTPSLVMALPGDPGCDPLDPACPIDGGLSLLIAAGIGVGAKKAYDAKKRKAQ